MGNIIAILALAVAILVPVLTATFGIGQFMGRADLDSWKVGIEEKLEEG